MKTPLFIDTGYFLALLNKKDKNHNIAKNNINKLKESKIIISDFILFETITFFNSSLKNHNLAVTLLNFINSKDNIEIIEVNHQIKSNALSIFLKYSDKDFSFTDCTSFAIMEELNIVDAFSFDIHFKQMGFNILV